LPTFNIFTLHGYSIYPGAVVVAEIPVVAESTEVYKNVSDLNLCGYTKIHKVQLKKECRISSLVLESLVGNCSFMLIHASGSIV
jgi:hypothetical protein